METKGLLTYNLFPAELMYLIFHPLEIVFRDCDPQLWVSENSSFFV